MRFHNVCLSDRQNFKLLLSCERLAMSATFIDSPVQLQPTGGTVGNCGAIVPVLKTTRGNSAPVRAIRVLHLINGEYFSGAERVQQLLGLGLPEFGFSPQFACVKPGKFREHCGLPDDIVFDTPMNGRFDLKLTRKLAKLVRSSRVELLHAHTPRTALIAAITAKRAGVAWIYHVHSPTARDSTRGLINRINDLVERLSIRNCQCLITVSKSLRHEMLSRGYPRNRLVCIPNGVQAAPPIDHRGRLTQSTWRLGLLALMRPRKGIEVALDAMAQLRGRNLPVTLELIGGFETEEYQRKILGQIDALNLHETVRWTGFTADVQSAIGRLDALVLPSLFGEGMPMVVLEALAAGVPVIATRVEGTPEVVRDGIEGLLAQPRDSQDLARKIAQLTENRMRWAEMGQHALLRHRSRFSDVEMARKVARAYRRVLRNFVPICPS